MLEVLQAKISDTMAFEDNVFLEILDENTRSNAADLSQRCELEQETRTLIYLSIAFATGNKTRIEDIMNKAKMQNITREKILEVFKISVDVESEKVMNNAGIIHGHLKNTKLWNHK